MAADARFSVLLVALAGCGGHETPAAPEDSGIVVDDSGAVVDSAVVVDSEFDASPPGPKADELEPARQACNFTVGALAKDTIGNLPSHIPLEHLIILLQENRSFDTVLGRHPRVASGDFDGFPAGYVNVATGGATYPPEHATSGCPAIDPPHDWASMHASWNGGKNDGFYAQAASLALGGGNTAISYYEPADLPFYTWLYDTFATSDRYFSAVLGPTAPNRSFFWFATSGGNQNAGAAATTSSILDSLVAAGKSVRLYAGTTFTAPKSSMMVTVPLSQLSADLASGDLPDVAFVEPVYERSEHAPYDIAEGERFVHEVVTEFLVSHAWSTSALVVTYDEAGGFFDHVPPPKACPPDDASADFDHLGFRVPFVVVSPYARRRYVSHRTHTVTSITRLLEAMYGLPALTARDANSDALLDLFDFDAAPQPAPTDIPAASAVGCP